MNLRSHCFFAFSGCPRAPGRMLKQVDMAGECAYTLYSAQYTLSRARKGNTPCSAGAEQAGFFREHPGNGLEQGNENKL